MPSNNILMKEFFFTPQWQMAHLKSGIGGLFWHLLEMLKNHYGEAMLYIGGLWHLKIPKVRVTC